MSALSIALDVLREAIARKWFLALALIIAIVLALLGASLQMEIIDGALAATSLFGETDKSQIRAVDVAMRPVFAGTSYLIFYGGLVFGILACSDFGPSLLAPGRIEHLLSMPIRRSTLLFGTYLGVNTVMLIASLYGSVGLTIILGAKTGLFVPGLVYAALLGSLAFAAIYAAMLTAALYARSAAVSALAGLTLFAAGIVSSYRFKVAPAFSSEIARTIFETVSGWLPPIGTLAEAAASLAGGERLGMAELGLRLLGIAIFGAATLAIGIWRFEAMDF